MTPEQVKNWRRILFEQLGPWALIMPVSEIEAVRDRMQRLANTLSGEVVDGKHP